MTNNGNNEYCLGIQIKCNEVHKIIFLSQEKYSYDILHKFDMETCKPHCHSSLSKHSLYQGHDAHYP
jgi:hypothetical protein